MGVDGGKNDRYERFTIYEWMNGWLHTKGYVQFVYSNVHIRRLCRGFPSYYTNWTLIEP